MLVNNCGNPGVARVIWMADVATLTVAEEFPFSQFFASHWSEQINDLIILKAKILCNLWNDFREFPINDLLTHLVKIGIRIKWYRNHQIQLGLRFHSQEVPGHLLVIRNVSLLVPLKLLGIISAKHERHNVSITSQGRVILWLVPVGIIAIPQHGPATASQIYDLILLILIQHVSKLGRPRLGLVVRGSQAKRNGVTDSDYSGDSFLLGRKCVIFEKLAIQRQCILKHICLFYYFFIITKIII